MRKALANRATAATIDEALRAALAHLGDARSRVYTAAWHFEGGINRADGDQAAAYWADFAREGELMAMAEEIDALRTRINRLKRRVKAEAQELAALPRRRAYERTDHDTYGAESGDAPQGGQEPHPPRRAAWLELHELVCSAQGMGTPVGTHAPYQVCVRGHQVVVTQWDGAWCEPPIRFSLETLVKEIQAEAAMAVTQPALFEEE